MILGEPRALLGDRRGEHTGDLIRPKPGAWRLPASMSGSITKATDRALPPQADRFGQLIQSTGLIEQHSPLGMNEVQQDPAEGGQSSQTLA